MLQYEEGMRLGAATALKSILRNSRGMSASEKREWRKVGEQRNDVAIHQCNIHSSIFAG